MNSSQALKPLLCAIAALGAVTGAAWGPQAAAQGWGSGWPDTPRGVWTPRGAWDEPPSRSRRSGPDPREGRVEVNRFATSGPEAAELGHGAVAVSSSSGEGPLIDPRLRRTYEAAVVDALVGVGYDTQHPDAEQRQEATLTISRRVLTPAEEKQKPVSGSAAIGVGNRGTSYGLALDVDLTKPRSALVSTRMEARIVDKASGKVLWEGNATIATREGDDDWGDQRIAMKLASALFEGFPKADPVAVPGEPG